jgi:hypothetical protein
MGNEIEVFDQIVHAQSGRYGNVIELRKTRVPMLKIQWSDDGEEEWVPPDVIRKDGKLPLSHSWHIFNQQNGDVTKAYYAEMNARGLPGQLAVALFRAQKRSTAAKRYKGRKFTAAAYDVKNWSLSEVCRVLTTMQAFESAPRWGWKRDPRTPGYEWVLYCDLPTGQCSFHSASRLSGPDYTGEWDGMGMSRERICRYCDMVENA